MTLPKASFTEQVVFSRPVTLHNGDTLTILRHEDGATQRVFIKRADGSTEDVPFTRVPGPSLN